MFLLHKNTYCEYSLEEPQWGTFNEYTQHVFFLWKSGPSCSKLTTSLVNDSLKFTSSDVQICCNFSAEKMWVAFAVASHIFSAKNFRKLYIVSAKIVNEMALNELIKLMTLWTTGPRKIFDWVQVFGPVNPLWSCWVQLVYLTTFFLGRLCPLSS